MTIDLSKPEHREALEWACTMTLRAPRLAAAICGVSSHEERNIALRALTSPVESAAIIRALLEGCGVTVVEHGVNRGTPDFPYVSIDDGQRYDNGDAAPLYVSFGQATVPAKVLRLLAAATREEALAALRGAS